MTLDIIFGIPRILKAKTIFLKHWDKSKPTEIPNPLETFFFPEDATLKTKGRAPWTTDEYDDWMIRLGNESTKQVERVSDDDVSIELRKSQF